MINKLWSGAFAAIDRAYSANKIAPDNKRKEPTLFSILQEFEPIFF